MSVRTRGLLTALAGAAVLAAVTLAPAVPAAVRGSSQQIAYSDNPNFGDLYIGTTAGNDGQTIFQGDGTTVMTALSISPDGSDVLARASADQDQLVLVPVTGSAPVPIDGTVGADSGSFSPDGTAVLFSIGVNTSDTLSPGIYSVPVAGGTPTQIVASPDGATDSLPQLSPDGRQLAFVRDAVDSSGNDDVTLVLMPAAGGAVTALADGLAPTLDDGERLSFSPDGKTIAYSDYRDLGIWTVGVAGGAPVELTSSADYWPVYSSDGSTLIFSRDAFSPDADDNAAAPVDLQDDDVDELWTMNADGSNVAVVAEGDFESLAVAPYASKGSGGSGGGSSGGGSTAPKSAAAIHVAVHGTRYVVTWKGKASAWKVLLKVGKQTASAKVKGSVHTHTFTLRGAKGTPHASVKSA